MSDPITLDRRCLLSHQVELLLHTLQELSLVRKFNDVQSIVSKAARQMTGCDGATFVLRENGHCSYVEEDAITPLWKGQRFPLDQCISGWVMLNRAPAIIEDVFSDPRIPHAVYHATFVKSLVMVPIRTLDPIGAIGTYWSQPHLASGEEVHLLQTLADSVSVVLENVRVYQELDSRVKQRTAELEQALQQIERLSITDELSGLYNRRGFRLLAGQVLRRVQRSQEPFILVFLDVDGLKQVNDLLGHRSGDALLEDTAQLLRDCFRESDILARVGGDEFCVLALGTHDEHRDIRQRLENALAQFNRSAGKPYRLDCSFGILLGPLDTPHHIDDLIALADERMYLQKNAKHRDQAVGSGM